MMQPPLPETPSTHKLNRRSVAFGVGALVWLALVFAYVGSMWPMAIYRIVIEGMCWLAWLVAALGIGGVLQPLFRLKRDSHNASLLVATSASLGLGAMSLLVLLLGLAGLLNRLTAIGIIAVGIILSIAWLLRSNLQTPDIRAWFAKSAGWNWLWLLAGPFAAVTTVGAMYPPYLLWTQDEPHGYDVVEYHLQVPREWFEAHRIVPLTHNAFSFFPFNVEMHYLLAMHLRGGPWAGMYLAQFMHAGFMLLLVLAAWAGADAIFSRKSERPTALVSDPPSAQRGVVAYAGTDVIFPVKSGRWPTAGIVAGLAVVSAPLIAQLGAIAYDEGGFLLFGILSLIWAMLAVRDVEDRVRRFVLAGVFAGLSCGSKLTGLPEIMTAIGVIAVAMLLFQKSPNLVKRMMPVVAFAVAGMLTFSPWLIRNQIWVGNPVFPELPSLGHGYFSQSQIERWHHAHTPQPQQRGIPARLKAGVVEVLSNWQFGYVLIPVGVIAIALSRLNPHVRFLAAMLALLALFWLGFTHLQGRFFVLGIPICALILASAPRLGLPAVVVTILIGIVTLNLQFLTSQRRDAIAYIGIDDLSPLAPIELDKVIPPDAKLVLVGDAKAFLYQMPMSRLSYRTIFDVNAEANPDLIDAFAGPKRPGEKQWLLIDPNELKRFEQTYQPFPPVPAEIAARDQPYAVPR
jgi:hypothetical protein